MVQYSKYTLKQKHMGTPINTIPEEWAPSDWGNTDTAISTESIQEALPTVATAIETIPESAPATEATAASVMPTFSGNAEDGFSSPARSGAATEKKLSFGEYSLSIDEVFRDIKRLTLTKNPLDLLFKANEIREKLAFFINSLAAFISTSFSFENKSFTDELYHDACYHEVWMELAGDFIHDMHYCNGTVMSLVNPESGKTIDIDAIIERTNNSTLTVEDFSDVKILIEHIIKIYRKKDVIGTHLEQYNKEKNKSPSREKNTTFATHSLLNTKRTALFETVNALESEMVGFPYTKESFIENREAIMSHYNLNVEEKERVRAFCFHRIIDLHYPNVQHIFFDRNLPYGTTQTFLTKREWLNVKGRRELTLENIDAPENKIYFSHIWNCKNLVLELQENLLSPILLPIILKLAASSMSLRRADFKKFSYILLFLFANSYEKEYIPLARFLNELEVYINYDNSHRAIEKLKIGFSLITLFILFVILGYFILPPLVFIPGIILVGAYLKMYFIDDYTISANINYNLGGRLWATVVIAVFGYAWLTNIGSYTDYYSSLQKRVTGFGSHVMAQIIPPEQIAEGVKHGAASILQWNNQK